MYWKHIYGIQIYLVCIDLFSYCQVYWAGPMLGGVLAGITYQVSFQAKRFKDEKKDKF